MTTVFILFSARTTLNCVLDMGNFELKHALLWVEWLPFLWKKYFSRHERKKRKTCSGLELTM